VRAHRKYRCDTYLISYLLFAFFICSSLIVRYDLSTQLVGNNFFLHHNLCNCYITVRNIPLAKKSISVANLGLYVGNCEEAKSLRKGRREYRKCHGAICIEQSSSWFKTWNISTRRWHYKSWQKSGLSEDWTVVEFNCEIYVNKKRLLHEMGNVAMKIDCFIFIDSLQLQID